MGVSHVKWVRLGDYIGQCNERNHNNKGSIKHQRDKQIIIVHRAGV